MDTKDSVGNMLNDGDTVTVTKDLKIKGMSKIIKRGTKVIFVFQYGRKQFVMET